MTEQGFQATLLYLQYANWVLLFPLFFAALLPFYLARNQQSFDPQIRMKVFFPLAAGFLLWAVAYWLNLTYHGNVMVQWWITILDLAVLTAFVFCGSSLLRLERRIHQQLPPPSPRGFDHRWFVTIPAFLFGHRLTFLFFFFSGAALLLVSGLLAAEPAHLKTINAVFSFFGMAILGFGFLRELNRTRADWTGVVTASVMLVYAGCQLLANIKSVQLPVYTIGIVSKGIMIMGIVSFFELSREARIAFSSAYRQAHEEFSDKILQLLAHHRSARHSIFNATSKQGFIVKEVAREVGDEQRRHLDKIVEQAKVIEQQAQTLLSLTETDTLFAHCPASEFLVNVQEELDGLYGSHIEVENHGRVEPDFPVAHDILREALHRIIENAAREGASTISLKAQAFKNKRVISICNDGPPIPEDVQRRLFNTRRGGFWVARRIAINLGGTISLRQSTSQQTCFEIVLPPSEDGYE